MADKRIIELDNVTSVTEDDYVMIDNATNGTGKVKATLFGGGISYSTTEQDTGLKWIDGKHIYQKTHHISELTEKTEEDYDISNDNADKVIYCEGVIKAGAWGGSRWFTVPRIGGDDYFISISASSTTIAIKAR